MLNLKISPDVALTFILLFARMGGLGMLMPGFGETGIPARFRLTITLLITVLFYPVLAPLLPHGLLKSPALLGFTLLGEIALGLFIGLVGRLTLSALQVAGATIAAQAGLSFAMAVDPTQGQQGAVIGNFLSVVGLTLVFVFDLHHLSVRAIVSSYQLFPPGQMVVIGDFTQAALTLTAESFKIGIQVAAPFVVFGLVFNFGLGLIAKLMPQFQVFFVAMPLSILASFVLLFMLMGTLMLFYTDHVEAGLMRLIVR